MARTAAAAALTLSHQRLQRALSARVLAQLLRLWPAVDPRRPETFDLFSEAATLLVRDGHRQSSGLAARYYAGFRLAEGLADDAPARLAPAPSPERVSGLLRGSAVTGILRARAAGFSAVAERDQAWVRLAGQASSLVLGGGRSTTLALVEADPQVKGWQRVTSGEACAFCAMLASRGPVYGDDDFQAHDNCACGLEPALDGSQPPGRSGEYRALWDESTAGLSGGDAFTAFRHALEAPALEEAA
jgi:hypothetical protein